jgi:hypothetical protein
VGEGIVGENPCDKAFENSCQVALKASPAPNNMKVFCKHLEILNSHQGTCNPTGNAEM